MAVPLRGGGWGGKGLAIKKKEKKNFNIFFILLPYKKKKKITRQPIDIWTYHVKVFR